MKKAIIIISLFLLFSCSNNDNIVSEKNTKSVTNSWEIAKKKETEIKKEEKNICSITFETVEKDLLRFNIKDNKCNNGIKEIKSQEVEYNNATWNYNESIIKLDSYDLTIKQDKILYSSFGAYSNDIFKENVDLKDWHKIEVELLAIYSFDSLWLSDEEAKQKAINENIDYYILKATLWNINIIWEVLKGSDIKGVFENFKNEMTNTKIEKENIIESKFEENSIYIKSNFWEYSKKINIKNYKYDWVDSYDFSNIDWICMPNTYNKWCEIYKFENNKIYWWNELIDRNAWFDYKFKVSLETNAINGDTILLDEKN